jgi:hypothetical protein
VKQGFSLGTVGGARAVAMEKEVGRCGGQGCAPGGGDVEGVVDVGKKMRWRDVTGTALESKRALKEKTDTIDMKKVEECVVGWSYMNEGTLERQKA